jgi:amino acid transporter
MRWVVGILAWAAPIVGFVTALGTILPDVLEEPFRSFVILGLVGFLGVLNMFGLSLFKHLNNVVTIAKILPLIFFILIGVFYLNHFQFEHIRMDNFKSEGFGTAALVLFYAFGGFETLVVVAGEMKDPRKNMPNALRRISKVVDG